MKKILALVLVLITLISCKDDSPAPPTQTLDQKLLGKWKWISQTAEVTPQGGATNTLIMDKDPNAYIEFFDDKKVNFSNDGTSISETHTMTVLDQNTFSFSDDTYIRHITKLDATHLEFYYDYEQSNTLYKYKFILTK